MAAAGEVRGETALVVFFRVLGRSAAKGKAVGKPAERCPAALGCCLNGGFAEASLRAAAAGTETRQRGSGPARASKWLHAAQSHRPTSGTNCQYAHSQRLKP